MTSFFIPPSVVNKIHLIKTILPLILSGAFLIGTTLANTTKNAADATFYNVGLALRSFKKAHEGTLPQDWEAFIRSGYLSGDVLNDARRFCDIENRYFFLNLPTVFDEGFTQKRIIVMARQPGGEGNVNRTFEDGRTESIPGRYVIVDTVGAQLESGRFSEKRLQVLFEKAGFNLKDYTFEAPPQPQPIKSSHPSESLRIPSDPGYLWGEKGPRPERSKDDISTTTSQNPHSGSMSSWKWIGLALVLASMGAYLRLKKLRV